MQDEIVNELVAIWFSEEHTMFDACTDEPELAWRAIIEICSRDLTEDEEGLLAAGPLETLLSWHGATFIDRVVTEATKDQHFKTVLKLMWRHGIQDDIWVRIENARA